MNRRLLAFTNLLGFIITIILNALANALPINGQTTGELSDAYPNLFVPAGLTFAIWSLIYLLLLIFVVYGLVAAFSKNQSQSVFLEKIGWWFFISCLCNASWIVAWHYEIVPLSLMIMLGILGSLIMIYRRLGIGTGNGGSREKFLVHMAFSIYLGWITVATIANVTTLLVDNGIDGGGSAALFAASVIVVAIVMGSLFLKNRGDLFYALVVVWALYGIYLKRSRLDAEAWNLITITAVAGMVLLLIGGLLVLGQRKLYR
ncbi:MAG: hypothetical protein AAF206_15840 [Bacteroidota bacterium]